MAMIGDGPTEVWTAELRRTGRVVFPLRRRPLLRRTLSGSVFLMVVIAAQLPHVLKSGGLLRIVAGVVTVACAIDVCFNIWRLVTQRPALTVDGSGIRIGRRRFVPWSEIGAVTELDGSAGDPYFTVVPSGRGRKLRPGRDHVRNVAALRYWFVAQLQEHRSTAGGRRAPAPTQDIR
ncbi:hypothetical protein EV645_1070 [Kribbella rubisoli]|uniref:PH domain-containing protein n=1 Tax=Kribbella rubisoli TaxID=3075929 RepID=A0A4Q7X707_9ACTN|nr:hypothetical protein [Kribbella rubisoli]RZU18870.1 hypothetical protein EV645_1070 [Kribbella rubisoli]